MTPIFTILFTIAVVISASLLVILISAQYPATRRALLSRFKRAAKDAGIAITKHQLIGCRVIGVDMKNAKVLFFSKAGNKHEGYFVDLYDIKSVEVHKEYGLMFEKYFRNKVAETDVSKIALHLYFKNGAKRLALPFYDKKDDVDADIPLRGHEAKKWRDLLASIAARDVRMPREGRMTAFTTYLDAA